MAGAAAYVEAVTIALVASRARRLRRCMERTKLSALRASRVGRHSIAGQRWRLLVELHDRRNVLLRRWGLL